MFVAPGGIESMLSRLNERRNASKRLLTGTVGDIIDGLYDHALVEVGFLARGQTPTREELDSALIKIGADRIADLSEHLNDSVTEVYESLTTTLESSLRQPQQQPGRGILPSNSQAPSTSTISAKAAASNISSVVVGPRASNLHTYNSTLAQPRIKTEPAFSDHSIRQLSARATTNGNLNRRTGETESVGSRVFVPNVPNNNTTQETGPVQQQQPEPNVQPQQVNENTVQIPDKEPELPSALVVVNDENLHQAPRESESMEPSGQEQVATVQNETLSAPPSDDYQMANVSVENEQTQQAQNGPLELGALSQEIPSVKMEPNYMKDILVKVNVRSVKKIDLTASPRAKKRKIKDEVHEGEVQLNSQQPKYAKLAVIPHPPIALLNNAQSQFYKPGPITVSRQMNHSIRPTRPVRPTLLHTPVSIASNRVSLQTFPPPPGPIIVRPNIRMPPQQPHTFVQAPPVTTQQQVLSAPIKLEPISEAVSTVPLHMFKPQTQTNVSTQSPMPGTSTQITNNVSSQQANEPVRPVPPRVTQSQFVSPGNSNPRPILCASVRQALKHNYLPGNGRFISPPGATVHRGPRGPFLINRTPSPTVCPPVFRPTIIRPQFVHQVHPNGPPFRAAQPRQPLMSGTPQTGGGGGAVSGGGLPQNQTIKQEPTSPNIVASTVKVQPLCIRVINGHGTIVPATSAAQATRESIGPSVAGPSLQTVNGHSVVNGPPPQQQQVEQTSQAHLSEMTQQQPTTPHGYKEQEKSNENALVSEQNGSQIAPSENQPKGYQHLMKNEPILRIKIERAQSPKAGTSNADSEHNSVPLNLKSNQRAPSPTPGTSRQNVDTTLTKGVRTDNLHIETNNTQQSSGPSSSASNTSSKVSSNQTRKIVMKHMKCIIDNCEKVLTNKAQLEKHLKLVHNSGLLICAAQGCGQSFQEGSKLGGHLNRDHHGVKSWPCPKCNVVPFESVRDLNNHTRLEHEQGLFGCYYVDCGFTGEIRKQVMDHVFEVHRNVNITQAN